MPAVLVCIVAAGPERVALEVFALVIAGVTVGVVCDALRQVCRRARRSERVYRESFHASPVPLVLRELTSGRAVDANDAWSRLTGWTHSELIGTTAADLGILSDADVALVTRSVAADGVVRDMSLGFRRKDGEQRESLLSAVIVDLDGVEHFLATILDVTDARRAESNAHELERRFRTERRTLEEELRQAQKMESLGRLAGGVAHDFNNILAVIAASADMLRDLAPEAGDSRELIDEVEHAVSRATGLTRQLLAFSRKQRTEPVVLDVNAVVGETRKMLRRMIGDDVGLETSLDPDLAHVRMDANHLVQVLMNLAVNARDAMPGGGKLVIETRNYTNGTRNVVLVVRDTGTGMTPDVRARIFEPFFTTKAAGKGTGMGLSVVHGIVELAHGHIDVESEPGRGTTFEIYLPAIDAPLDASVEPVKQAPSGIGTVLVVDDDPHVRHVIARALSGRGYRAIEAADGPTALALIDREAIDLLVTDLVMPVMNGHELADAARSSRPALKVLYTTGYADDEISSRCVGVGSALLEKPYRIDTLATKVAAMLSDG